MEFYNSYDVGLSLRALYKGMNNLIQIRSQFDYELKILDSLGPSFGNLQRFDK